MHPRGICELRDLGKLKHRSVDREDYTTTMGELYDQVKQRLQDRRNEKFT